MLTAIAWVSVAAGALLFALGVFALWASRRPVWGDVLDYVEPKPPAVVLPMRCICPARFPFCDCAVDGVRNPRGAGRAFTDRTFRTPPAPRNTNGDHHA